MLSLPADLLTVRRIVTRASTLPTLRDSSFTGFSRLCPAKAVECIAVAAAMSAHTFPNGGCLSQIKRSDGVAFRCTTPGGGHYKRVRPPQIALAAVLARADWIRRPPVGWRENLDEFPIDLAALPAAGNHGNGFRYLRKPDECGIPFPAL